MDYFFFAFFLAAFGFSALFAFAGSPLLPPSFIASKSSFLYIPAEPIYRNGLIPLRCNLLLIASDDAPKACAISNTVIPSIPQLYRQKCNKNQVVNITLFRHRNYKKVGHFDTFYRVIMTQCSNIGTLWKKIFKYFQKELDGLLWL